MDSLDSHIVGVLDYLKEFSWVSTLLTIIKTQLTELGVRQRHPVFDLVGIDGGDGLVVAGVFAF